MWLVILPMRLIFHISTQDSRLHKAFANTSSGNTKFSKTQLSKTVPLGGFNFFFLGGFLGRLLGPLMKVGLLLTKNVLAPSAKSALTPLGLTASMSATNAAIQNIIFGTAMTTLIASNEEIYDILKIVNSLEEFALLIKGVSETFQNEIKDQNSGFLGTL